jgi:hypothetical protein
MGSRSVQVAKAGTRKSISIKLAFSLSSAAKGTSATRIVFARRRTTSTSPRMSSS